MDDRFMIAGTGHRPAKLGGYGEDTFEHVTRFARKQLVVIRPTHVISGMALGWDMALARAAAESGIPFTAAIPFDGQDAKWPGEWQQAYHDLLGKAETVEVISPGGYASHKMQTRNVWMVDKCRLLLALWDGSASGTANCVDYARKIHRPILNVWHNWMRFSEAMR